MAMAEPYLRITIVKMLNGEIGAIGLTSNALQYLNLGPRPKLHRSSDITAYQTQRANGLVLAHLYATNDDDGNGVDSLLDLLHAAGALRVVKFIGELIKTTELDEENPLVPLSSKTPLEPLEVGQLSEVLTLVGTENSIRQENDKSIVAALDEDDPEQDSGKR